MRATRWVLAVLLVAAGIYFLPTSEPNPSGDGEIAEIGSQNDEQGQASGERGAGARAPTVSWAPEGPKGAIRDGAPRHDQGITGRVVAMHGGPVAGAPVYLLHGCSPQHLFLRAIHGRLKPRVAAETITDASGSFRLSARPSSGTVAYDLRIVASGYVPHSQPIRVVTRSWTKLGRIALDSGHTLRGIVRDGASKRPLAEAIVRVLPPSLTSLVPTPGLEDGIETRSDRNGRYELTGLPRGPSTVTALARGFGTLVRRDLTFAESERVRIEDLELPRGFEISGVVTTSSNRPIANARVEATPFANGPLPGHTYSDADGGYTLIGLGEGPYVLSAEARGYVRSERKPIEAGARDVRILLQEQGKVLVRVRTKSGRALRRFSIELRRFFPETPDRLGRTAIPRAEVRSAKGGEYLLAGVDPGKYVVEVAAMRHAKTFSDPFEVVHGAESPTLVELRLNEGATITGVIVDPGGQPVRGARVSSLEASYQEIPIIGDAFRSLMVQKVSEATVTSDERGRFRLERLVPGAYQLRIDHPQFTRTSKNGIELTDGQKFDVGRLVLSAGCVIRGVVYDPKNRPVVAGKVTVSSAADSGLARVFEIVFTDAKGKFTVARPLPPGKYKVEAARTDHAHMLMQLVDTQNSTTIIDAKAGMQPIRVRIRKP